MDMFINAQNDLEELVKYLISLKREGEYWDFKEQWYSKEKKSDMLHDIICMANNPTRNDGLLIIGVEDEDKRICGVENDDNRRTTQNLVDFLQDKQFHGDNRPYVQVTSITIDDHTLDVVRILSSSKVPYILKADYQDVHKEHIYSRVEDHNTPKNKSADIALQEQLWRRRFGLDLSPLDRMYLYLDDTSGWNSIDEENLSQRYYYKQHPEFVVEQVFDDERNGFEVFLTYQCDKRPHWGWFNLYYHQTRIASYQTAILDGGRATVPVPDTEYSKLICQSKRSFNLPYRYRYYVAGEQKWKILQNIWQNKNTHSEESIAIRNLFRLVPVFNSQLEKKQFDDFLFESFSENILSHIPDGYFGKQVEVPEALQSEYKFYVYCTALLDEFRELHNLPIPELGFEE